MAMSGGDVRPTCITLATAYEDRACRCESENTLPRYSFISTPKILGKVWEGGLGAVLVLTLSIKVKG